MVKRTVHCEGTIKMTIYRGESEFELEKYYTYRKERQSILELWQQIYGYKNSPHLITIIPEISLKQLEEEL